MNYSVVACVIAAFAGFAMSTQAQQSRGEGYTNADITGGYGCNLSGTIQGADAVGTAQFHPDGAGNFKASVFTLQIRDIGVCLYSLERGTGTYNVKRNGTGIAKSIYTLQPGSDNTCPSQFLSNISFVCSGAVVTADTCDIASLDPGNLLSGTCKKQNK